MKGNGYGVLKSSVRIERSSVSGRRQAMEMSSWLSKEKKRSGHSVDGSDTRSDHDESVIMSHPHLQCAGSLEERVAQLEAWARRVEADIGGVCEQLQRCMAMAVDGFSTGGTRKSSGHQAAPAAKQYDNRESVGPFYENKVQHTIPLTTGIRQADIAGISYTSSSVESGGHPAQHVNSTLPDADIALASKMPNVGVEFSSEKLDALGKTIADESINGTSLLHDETSMLFTSREACTHPEVGSNRMDPYMPAFVNVAELSSSGLEASANVEPPPGFEHEIGGSRLEASVNVEQPPGLEHEVGGRCKHEKRREIIQMFKLKSFYKEYSEILERGEELPCEVPSTPDPMDENISKRKWESLVSQWRAALRQVEIMRKKTAVR